VDEAYDHLAENFKETAPINLRINASQSSELKRRAVDALGDKLPPGMFLSAQDVITGLVVSAVNRCDPEIDHIYSLFNVKTLRRYIVRDILTIGPLVSF
jgi:hypothetical protein